MADGQEWRAWLDRHAPGMLLLARQFVPSAADAEDVVQEAFLRFWWARQRGDQFVADPVAYLFGCVKHTAVDWQRGGQRRLRREQALASARAEAAPDEPLLTGPLEQEERRIAIEAALVRLPAPQREVLIMKIWAGLSFPQIAQALGIPSDTAASRYRYAVAKLREQLAGELIP
jgi:RNA polymerase sigma-70 factor (ECF subfamily)